MSFCDCIITENTTRNTRSHEKVGVETLEVYEGKTEEWTIVVWDCK